VKRDKFGWPNLTNDAGKVRGGEVRGGHAVTCYGTGVANL
jgi:hypothetical protein